MALPWMTARAIREPILFLDIDGVLIAYPEDEAMSPHFTPRCVAALKKVIKAVPEMKIVFSSTWRLPEHVARLREQWTAHGLPPELTLDGTPDTRRDSAVAMRTRRGVEIRAWLEAHPEVKQWVAIDDDREGIGSLIEEARCVFTDLRDGFTEDQAARVVAMLRVG